MREVRLGTLLVVLDRPDVPAVRDADDDRHLQASLVAVRELRQLRRDLVERGEDEPVELDLEDGAEAPHRETDRGADDARLRQGRVDDAARPEVLLQSLGDAEDAAERTDVLAHEQDAVVRLERATEAGVEGAADREVLGHCAPPSIAAS